ncbi:MAG: hypothetical protein LBS43_04430 [Prevotellaceae bacterium]|nr:hypothetical protein [Prevotellaceae bacterium]
MNKHTGGFISGLKVKLKNVFKMSSKLNLSSYGVEEMSQQEMLIVDGGNLGKAIYEAVKFICEAFIAGALYDLLKEASDVVSDQYQKHGDDFTANAMRGH